MSDSGPQQQQHHQQQQQPAASADAAAAAVAADPAATPQNGHKPKQLIKYVAPLKTTPGNPNFAPKMAWPGGSIVVKLPANAPPPGTHRWKQNGHNGAQPQPPNAARGLKPFAAPAGSRLRAGSVNMHSAVALELQSAGSRGGASHAGNANGHFGGDTPEPGEVPSGPRRRTLTYAAGGAGNDAAIARPPSGLAQLYKQQAQRGSSSLLTAMAQRRGGGGSPQSGGGGTPSPRGGFGGSGDGTHLRGPSGRSRGFAEGYEEAEKVIEAATNGQWKLANTHAAIIAALPPGDDRDAACSGFRSRIRRQQQGSAHEAAYVAELEEYLQKALGGGGGGVPIDDSFSFGVAGSDSCGGFGSALSAAAPEAASYGGGNPWGATGDRRRGVGMVRHGSRRVELVGGGRPGREVSPAAGGGDRVIGGFKVHKRKAAWQPDSSGSPGPAYRKVVAVSGGGASTGNPKFAKARANSNPKFGKVAAAQQAPSKGPASPPPPQPSLAIGQKLSMSLDAIAGKPSGNNTAASKATGGGGGAAAGGSGKHSRIAWQR